MFKPYNLLRSGRAASRQRKNRRLFLEQLEARRTPTNTPPTAPVITEPTHDGVSLARNGVRDGNKPEFRVIGDERVYVWLPGYFRCGEQFRRAGTSGGQSRAVCKESDGGNGLIQATEQVDLRAVRAGGVGVGERRSAGNRIDRYPLRGSAVGHAKG